MSRNVLDYEPDIALFVSDQDPLLFYERITEVARYRLSDGGTLYFEINEQFGKEVCLTLANNGFINIELIQDLYGKDRFTKASLEHQK